MGWRPAQPQHCHGTGARAARRQDRQAGPAGARDRRRPLASRPRARPPSGLRYSKNSCASSALSPLRSASTSAASSTSVKAPQLRGRGRVKAATEATVVALSPSRSVRYSAAVSLPAHGCVNVCVRGWAQSVQMKRPGGAGSSGRSVLAPCKVVGVRVGAAPRKSGSISLTYMLPPQPAAPSWLVSASVNSAWARRCAMARPDTYRWCCSSPTLSTPSLLASMSGKSCGRCERVDGRGG